MTKRSRKHKIPPIGKARRFAAVDFDSRHLRIVLAELTPSGTRIASLTNLPIPDSLDVGNPQSFGKFLGDALKNVGFRGAGVVMNVPRSEAILKPLAFPPGTPTEDLPEMVHYQVELELPFPAEDAVIDFTTEHYYGGLQREQQPDAQASEETTGEINILAAAIRLSVVDYYRQVAEGAGVKLLRLGLRPCANMRCVAACEGQANLQRLALVQITADETEIDVIAQGSLVFSRSAVKVVAFGESPVEDAVGSLVSEIARTLHSYEAFSRGEGIDGVLLAGDTGVEAQAAESLTTKIGVPCRMLAPQQVLGGAGKGEIDSAFVSALGQALAHPRVDRTPFDFINPKRPPVRRDPKKVRAAIIAGSAAALLLVMIVGGWIYLSAKRSTYNALVTRKNELKKELVVARKLAQRSRAIEMWKDESGAWLDHWAYLSCLFPTAKDVYVSSISANADGSISLSIQAHNDQALTELGRRLNDGGYEFSPGQVRTGEDPHGYSYNTTVRVFVPKKMKMGLPTTQPVERPADDKTRRQFYGDRSSPRRGRRNRARRERG